MKFLNEDAVRHAYGTRVPPWGPVGYITYKRTYARILEPGNPHSATEEWWQTVLRCVNGIQRCGAELLLDDLWTLYDHMFNMRMLMSGRSLFIMGTKYSETFADALINCWFVSISSLRAFEFVFRELMAGGGVGFSVRAQDVFKLPPVKKELPLIYRSDVNDADFIVPDTRDGWVELLKRTLAAYFTPGVGGFTYSLHCIRSRGAPIKGFGGKASGPEVLYTMIQQTQAILTSRQGKELRPVDALDICNVIAMCVVAGNVRRSAQIAIGDPNDINYLNAKLFKDCPAYRQYSNNSIYAASLDQLPPQFWRNYDTVDKNGFAIGENYGLYNLPLARSDGRLNDEKPDESVIGLNPCGEINLADYEACNLVELFLPNIKDEEELKECARLAYICAKTITGMEWWYKETDEIVKRNRRIGISVSGVLQEHKFRKDQFQTLAALYDYLEELDAHYSEERGIPKSVRLTTVQPSGTKSLLAGTTHGIHAYWSEYAIRRIYLDVDEPLVKVIQQHGYHVEPKLNIDGSLDPYTMVAAFPTKAPDGATIAEHQTAVEQLDLIRLMQACWADNSVSSTVSYKPEELPAIKKWLAENYESNVKAISFMRHFGHGFKQAPYEPISASQYEQMKRDTRPIVSTNVNTFVPDEKIGKDCDGGVCQSR